MNPRIHKPDAARVVDVEGVERIDGDMIQGHIGHQYLRPAPNHSGVNSTGGCNVPERNVAPNWGSAAQPSGALKFVLQRFWPPCDAGGKFGGLLRADIDRFTLTVIAVNKDRRPDIGHSDVLVDKVLHQAASVVVGFQPDAILRAIEGAVDDRQVRDSRGDAAADGNTVPCTKGAIGDEQTVNRTARAHRDVVVAIANMAIFDDAVRADEIKPIGVVRVHSG